MFPPVSMTLSKRGSSTRLGWDTNLSQCCSQQTMVLIINHGIETKLNPLRAKRPMEPVLISVFCSVK